MLAIGQCLAIFILVLVSSLAVGEEAKDWNDKRAAVVLTYDDSLNVHLDKVIPALNKRRLRGTFYVTINPLAFSSRTKEWQQAAASGHELGNHTLFHPCAGNLEGREWVNPNYDLANYSLNRMLDEIALTNNILASLDGLKERTYAYTCGDTHAGNDSYVDAIKPLFVGARGVRDSFTPVNHVDLFNINAFGVFENTGAELIAQVQQAISQGSMVVFLFHGVGGEHQINVSEQAHTELLNFLQTQKKEIWVTTMVNAARFLRDRK